MKNLMTKTMKTLAVAGMTMGLAHGVLADGITDVKAQQRYPWNGKVDISFTMRAGGFVPPLKIAAIDRSTTPWTTNVASAANLSGDTSLVDGEHKIVWDLDAEGLQLKSSDVVFTVSTDPISNTNDWLVIDLSGGSTATRYPVETFATPPKGDGWNQDVYKTSKLVLRRIPAGSVIKDTGTGAKIDIDQPYYAGIFEVTKAQYGYVVNGKNLTDKTPMDNSVSMNTFRGTDGFISNLVARVGSGFDLPTEEQWEYACRAGTSTKFNYGSDVGDDGYMWYLWNAWGIVQEVGTASKEKTAGGNKWGLYDMHGNFAEFTLTPPTGMGMKGSVIVRGGHACCQSLDECSSSAVANGSCVDASPFSMLGFRLFGNIQAAAIGVSSTVRVDLPTGKRMAKNTEILTYSPDWFDGDGEKTATVLIEGGATLVDEETTAGEYVWTLTTPGTYNLKHQIKIGGEVKDELNATFEMPATVVLPEIKGATAALYAFDAEGGWASVETNRVPGFAKVRVVWTVTEEGKALAGEGAVSVFQWQTELVASNMVQTAPAPTVVDAGESEITLRIDTRTSKKYFDAADILPIWYAQDAEVKVNGATLVKDAGATNTVAWVPMSNDVYKLTHTKFDDATIILTDPVLVTTNDVAVKGATVEVTADGVPLPENGIVPSNSVIVATWTIAPGSGVYFMDGTTTYTQTFEAGKSVNPVSEAVTVPEEPKAPKLKLGVVAQRYPWDGKIDVQYWAQYTPNTGYEITITVTLPDGTPAKSETYACKNGKNTVAFDARAAFGEVQFKSGVKVKATLSERK